MPPFETVDIEATKDLLHRALEDVYQFKLRFLNLEYGPDDQKPRLAWIRCAASQELISLQKKLFSAFDLKEKGSFTPHMTIARFNERDIGQIKRRSKSISRPVKLSMVVNSIQIFESPQKGETGYTVIESVHLESEEGGIPN